MKKHLVLLSFTAYFFLVAFTTSESKKIEHNDNLTTLTKTSNIGGAYLTFAGKFGGDVNKKNLKTTNKLGVSGCASGSLITKFTLKIKRQKKKVLVFKGKSHLLSDNVKTVLQTLVSGDSFEFSQVTAQLPSGGKVRVVSRKFTVTP